MVKPIFLCLKEFINFLGGYFFIRFPGFELLVVDAVVQGRGPQQFLVLPAGGDASLVQHQDQVSALHGAEAVCYYEGRAPTHEVIQG